MSEAAAARSFGRFAANLYCSAAEERRCALPGGLRTQPGQCFWYKTRAGPVPVSEEDMRLEKKPRWPSDKWDPIAAGAVAPSAFPPFDLERAARCVRGLHVHVIGDSTTRDTYYELLAAVGRPIYSGAYPTTPSTIWPSSSWHPAMPRVNGRDVDGACMSNGRRRVACLRSRDFAGADGRQTRLSFQFLAYANSTWELEKASALVGARAPDVVFVQCMMYEWLDKVGAMGEACMQHVRHVLGRGGGVAQGAASRVFLLGPTFPPGWVGPYERRHEPNSSMAAIFSSINAAAGIRCRRRAGGEYAVQSSKGLWPIDRYNVVGHRKREGIHPFFNAQYPVVWQMLRNMCPPAKESRAHAPRTAPRARAVGRTMPGPRLRAGAAAQAH